MEKKLGLPSHRDLLKVDLIVLTAWALNACGVPLPAPEIPNNNLTQADMQATLQALESFNEPGTYNAYLFAGGMTLTAEQLWVAEGVRMLTTAEQVLGIAVPYTAGVAFGAHMSATFQDMVEGRGPQQTLSRYNSVQEIRFNEEGVIQNDRGETVARIDAQANSDANAASKDLSNDFTASHQPPDGWKPPPKDYCGEDMQKYYAHLYLTEAVTVFMRPENIQSALNSPLLKDMDAYSKKANEIGQRLRDNNCYFYEGGSSVFMDYKLLRHRFWKVDGANHSWVEANMNLNMPTSQAYEAAYKLVGQWWGP